MRTKVKLTQRGEEETKTWHENKTKKRKIGQTSRNRERSTR